MIGISVALTIALLAIVSGAISSIQRAAKTPGMHTTVRESRRAAKPICGLVSRSGLPRLPSTVSHAVSRAARLEPPTIRRSMRSLRPTSADQRCLDGAVPAQQLLPTAKGWPSWSWAGGCLAEKRVECRGVEECLSRSGESVDAAGDRCAGRCGDLGEGQQETAGSSDDELGGPWPGGRGAGLADVDELGAGGGLAQLAACRTVGDQIERDWCSELLACQRDQVPVWGQIRHGRGAESGIVGECLGHAPVGQQTGEALGEVLAAGAAGLPVGPGVCATRCNALRACGYRGAPCTIHFLCGAGEPAAAAAAAGCVGLWRAFISSDVTITTAMISATADSGAV